MYNILAYIVLFSVNFLTINLICVVDLRCSGYTITVVSRTSIAPRQINSGLEEPSTLANHSDASSGISTKKKPGLNIGSLSIPRRCVPRVSAVWRRPLFIIMVLGTFGGGLAHFYLAELSLIGDSVESDLWRRILF